MESYCRELIYSFRVSTFQMFRFLFARVILRELFLILSCLGVIRPLRQTLEFQRHAAVAISVLTSSKEIRG